MAGQRPELLVIGRGRPHDVHEDRSLTLEPMILWRPASVASDRGDAS